MTFLFTSTVRRRARRSASTVRDLVWKTPLDVRLSPGQHSLSLEHPDAFEDDRPLHVAEDGAVVDVALWRRHPDVVPLRPVYPGASLVDARFLDDGQVALLVGASRSTWSIERQSRAVAIGPVNGPAGSGHRSRSGCTRVDTGPGAQRPAGCLRHARFSGCRNDQPVAGQRQHARTGRSQESIPTRCGSRRWMPASRRDASSNFLPPVDLLHSSVPERITGVAWTPDGLRLVVTTRQAGPPVRSRIFLIDAAARNDAGSEPDSTELVLLPAEVIPAPR